MINRRTLMQAGVAGGLAAWLPALARAQGERTIRVGMGFKAMSPAVINLYIPETLGYARDAGLKIESAVLGSANNCMIALEKGDVDFAVISSSFILPLMEQKKMSSIVIFYEYTYPYKWDIAVRPDASYQSYADLKGKKIGVSNLGVSDYPVTRTVLSDIGIDPDADVEWIAVGEGATAGIALQRGDIDALGYFDTGFGAIENAGIELRYLPRPAKVPMIGGLFLGVRRDFLEANRDVCVAYGRTVAMASEYLLENPAAGAAAFLEMFPETAPRGASPQEAVDKTVTAIARRIPLYRPPYPDSQMGQIFESEFELEAEMLGIQIDDFKPLYTNELIAEINDFDREAVIRAAREAKI
jgi:NitT/TauT family transport system substrate-binding protein